MTVGELIEKLKAFPTEMIVTVQMHSNELGNGREAGRVELVHASRSPNSLNWSEDFYPGQFREWDLEDTVYDTVINVNC